MTDRKQAEEILRNAYNKYTKKYPQERWDEFDKDIVSVIMAIDAMEAYAALRVAEATKEMYPKEFIEWLVLNEKFLPEIHRDIDNNVLAWGYGDYESNDIQTYSIDYVFEYWKQNISKNDNG